MLKVNPTIKKIEEILSELTSVKQKLGKEKEETSGLKVIQFEYNVSVDPSENELAMFASSVESDTSNISRIEKAFSNLELRIDSQNLKLSRLRNKVNPTSLTKNWYPKPTPPDIQFEERTHS